MEIGTPSNVKKLPVDNKDRQVTMVLALKAWILDSGHWIYRIIYAEIGSMIKVIVG